MFACYWIICALIFVVYFFLQLDLWLWGRVAFRTWNQYVIHFNGSFFEIDPIKLPDYFNATRQNHTTLHKKRANLTLFLKTNRHYFLTDDLIVPLFFRI